MSASNNTCTLPSYSEQCENVFDGSNGPAPVGHPETLNQGEFKMTIVWKFCLVSILALSIAVPVRAQNPQQGDYYRPTQTTPQQLTSDQLRKTEEGDYYLADKMVLHHHRSAALATCTDGIKFASDRYVTCMLKEGETP
jgi:hypothetical protein